MQHTENLSASDARLVRPATQRQLQEWAVSRGTDVVNPLTQVLKKGTVEVGRIIHTIR